MRPHKGKDNTCFNVDWPFVFSPFFVSSVIPDFNLVTTVMIKQVQTQPSVSEAVLVASGSMLSALLYMQYMLYIKSCLQRLYRHSFFTPALGISESYGAMD